MCAATPDLSQVAPGAGPIVGAMADDPIELPDLPIDDEQRRSGRIGQESVRSLLGPVLDLSGGGARILCREAPPIGMMLTVDLRADGDDAVLHLPARVVRVHRLGRRRYDVGLAFEAMDEQARRVVSRFAAINGHRRILGDPA